MPRSRSFTMAVAASSEPFRISSTPNVPVTMNQAFTRPGLYKNAVSVCTMPRSARRTRRPRSRIAGPDAFGRQRLVVGQDHAFRISLRDGGGVGVGRVQQDLHVHRRAAPQIARKLVRHHDAGIQLSAADGGFQIAAPRRNCRPAGSSCSR